MKIEVLIRWSEVRYDEDKKPEDYIAKLVSGEEKAPAPKVFYDYSPMTLDIEDIARFNRSNSPEFTTIRMKDGDAYIIKYPYADFKPLYCSLVHQAITPCLPKDYVDNGEILGATTAAEEGASDNDDDSDDLDSLLGGL